MNTENNYNIAELTENPVFHPQPTPRPRERRNAAFPLRINYRQTRTVEVNPDVLKENRIIAGMNNNAYSNAFKMLKAPILQQMDKNRWNTIGVTSPWKGEGKTLTAINLAISIACEINRTVLLVDANLRNPDVLDYFGVEAEAGLSNCLTGYRTIEEVLIHPLIIDRFVILPGGGSLYNAGEMISSNRMIDIIRDLESRYSSRIIIFDLPPMLIAGDPVAISSHLDSIVLVSEAGKTKKEDILKCESLLESSHIIASVLSKSRRKPHHHAAL